MEKKCKPSFNIFLFNFTQELQNTSKNFTIAKNTLKTNQKMKWHLQCMMKCDKYYRAFRRIYRRMGNVMHVCMHSLHWSILQTLLSEETFKWGIITQLTYSSCQAQGDVALLSRIHNLHFKVVTSCCEGLPGLSQTHVHDALPFPNIFQKLW